MKNKFENYYNSIQKLCKLANIDYSKFLENILIDLKNQMKELFSPNEIWFKEGKSFDRYWIFLEALTNHQWEYSDVEYWFKFLRSPSDTREEITASLRYNILLRDKSTCQKCGRSAPKVELEIDHILPWVCGGPTVISNLHVLCFDCNRGKSSLCFEGD